MNNWLCVFILLMPITALAQTVVEVFADAPMALPTIPDTRITLFDLSAPERVQRSLAPKLSPNPQDAQRAAQAFLNSAQGQDFKQQMREAYRGKVLMMEYGLTRIPAIVFDSGKYVVYGTTDIAESVRLYDHYRKEAPSHE